MDNRRVFAFLNERMAAGLKAVLVTVIAVEGSSMRDPGTHMGVCEDGSFAGSLSGGCIENAVIADALETLNKGIPRIVRFGSRSPYIDIRLPCGGGLDIHFQPLSDSELVHHCQQAIDARQPFSLRLPLHSGDPEFLCQRHPVAFAQSDQFATIGHCPEPKVLIIGHGATVSALSKLSRQMDLTVDVMTPDKHLLLNLINDGADARHLATTTETAKINSDEWTAIVFLFHDHDWEISLLAHALTVPHFYIGAMGGRKAHINRVEALGRLGCSEDAIASIHAPIGLFHSSRDPDTLALSTLAQVIRCYHAHGFTSARQ